MPKLIHRIQQLESRRPDVLPTVDIEIHQGQDQKESPDRYEKFYSHSITGFNGQQHPVYGYRLKGPKKLGKSQYDE